MKPFNFNRKHHFCTFLQTHASDPYQTPHTRPSLNWYPLTLFLFYSEKPTSTLFDCQKYDNLATEVSIIHLYTCLFHSSHNKNVIKPVDYTFT